MSRDMGYHWTPCRTGGGGGGGFIGFVFVAALVAVIVMVTRAAAKPVAHAFSAAGHMLTVTLEVAAITLASAAGLALGAGAVYGGLRLRRWQLARAARPQIQAPPQTVTATVTALRPKAIEAPRVTLTDVTAIAQEVIWQSSTDNGHRL